MDIDLLKTFLEVNRTRHFGRAADNLYLTPAAVSARVRQLEHMLGVELFLRSRNNIQLTPAGERLLPHAETLLLAWNRAREDVALQSEQLQQLNLGSTYSLWGFGLGQAVNVINTLLPDVAVRAEAHPGETLNRMLQERTLDLALLLEPPEMPGFKAERVGQVKLILVSTDSATTAKSALQSGYVKVDWGMAFELFHARRYGDASRPVLHTNMGMLALDYLRQQGGSAYLPQSVLTLPAGEGLTRVKGAPVFSRPVFAVYRSTSDRKETIGRLLNELKPLEI